MDKNIEGKTESTDKIEKEPNKIEETKDVIFVYNFIDDNKKETKDEVFEILDNSIDDSEEKKINKIENATDEIKSSEIIKEEIPDDNIIKLLTSDDQIIEVKREIILFSDTMKDIIEETEDNKDPISITVDKKIMKAIISYCEYHYDDPAETIEGPLYGNIFNLICTFDGDFLRKYDPLTIGKIVEAADYLSINSLLELCCAYIATTIDEKTPEEIREMYDINNDLNPEEAEKIREEFIKL